MRLLFPGLILGVVLGFMPLSDWNYWWHLAQGRIIAHWHLVPMTDFLVYTAEDRVLPGNQPWLFQFLLYQIHELGGVELTLIIRNILIGLTWSVFGWILAKRSGSQTLGIVVGALAGLTSLVWLSMGPEVITNLLATILLAVCASVTQTRRHLWRLLAIPVVTLLWTNIAGAFWIPIFMSASVLGVSYVTREHTDASLSRTHRRVWALAIFASLIVPLVSPYGLSIFLNSLHTPLYGFDWLMMLSLFAIVSVLKQASFFRSIKISQKRIPQPLFLTLFTVLAAAALCVQPTSRWQIDLTSSLSFTQIRQVQPMKGLLHADAPVECAVALGSFGSRPRIFHPPFYAGILTYHIQRADPWPMLFSSPFLDQSPDQVQTLYSLMMQDPDLARGIFVQYSVDTVVLDAKLSGELIERLHGDRAWRAVYVDSTQACFIKR